MNSKLFADYKILRVVEKASNVTQRLISKQTGLNLSSVNFALKRLLKKGYIKVSYTPKKRILYHLTPRGITEKGKLAYSFFIHNYCLFTDIRNMISERLNESKFDGKYFAIYGINHITDIAYLCLKNNGSFFAAIYEDNEDFIGEKYLEGEILPIGQIEKDKHIDYVLNIKNVVQDIYSLEVISRKRFIAKYSSYMAGV